MSETPEKAKPTPHQVRQWLEDGLATPPRTVDAFQSIESVRLAYAPPVTNVPAEKREAAHHAFDSAGGYESIYNSLTQHAIELGQFPMAGFLGYGVLQAIQQNGMIQNCVKTVADDVTREWISVTGGKNTDDERVEELQGLQDSKYGLQALFNEAQTTTGFLGGCFIYIDTDPNGDDPEHDPSEVLRISPDSEELQQGRKIEFRIIDPVNVCPAGYNADKPLRADYMKPERWWVMGTEVHASRLLRIVDNEPPTLYRPAYNFLGIPQAQILWDYVLHWNECRVSGAELLKKVSLLVYKTNARELLSSYGGIEQMDLVIKAVQRYRNNDSVFVCDAQDDVINVQTSVSGISDMIRQAQECIAAINRTPAVKLFGISPSGFNATGESDIRNYYDHVRSKQELKRDAIMECLKIIQLVEFGEIDDSITFEFNPLGKDDEVASTMNFSTQVNALLALKDRNIVNAEEVRQIVRGNEAMGLGFLSEDFEPDEEDELLGASVTGPDPEGGLMAMLGGNNHGTPNQ